MLSKILFTLEQNVVSDHWLRKQILNIGIES